MPFTFDPDTSSPISKAPYDVLREIFIHCLPQYPLERRQPNTKIAPILLCHVCAFWRVVALSIPTLWSHLRFNFILADMDASFLDLCFIAPKNHWQYEFLSWWRKNLGSRAPFVRLGVKWVVLEDHEEWLPSSDMTSLMGYISSAQYLELESPYWNLLGEWDKLGYDIGCPWPDLHTLVKYEWEDEDPFFSLLSDYPRSALRHLSLGGSVYLPDDFLIPMYWQTLTQISFTETSLAFQVWFSLIHELPYLQLGNFALDSIEDIYEDYHPAEHRHAHLHTLLIAVYLTEGDVDFPLSLLFTGLHLPVLKCLSLYSAASQSWLDTRAITELYTVLVSTPALTTLILGERFLSLSSPSYNGTALSTGNIQSVWHHATHLSNLEFTFNEAVLVQNKTQAKKVFETFCRNAFFSNSAWLDLVNPSCPIRKITVTNRMTHFPELNGLKLWDAPRNRMKVPNITFEIIPGPGRAIAFAAGVRREWGSKTCL